MKLKRQQHGRGRGHGRERRLHSLWVRALAGLCLLLVGMASTAQAAHVHGELLPSVVAKASTPVAAAQGLGEEHCSLCVAMHGWLPATMQVQVAPSLAVRSFTLAVVTWSPQRVWEFAMFSRPPPRGEGSGDARRARNEGAGRAAGAAA